MARKSEMLPVVGGNGKPHLRRATKNNWTKEKEREFLSALAETCNVTRACEAVGMSTQSAYWRRRRNAAFRATWIETIAAVAAKSVHTARLEA